MHNLSSKFQSDILFIAGVGFLFLLSILVLRSIAPFLFPLYFLYIICAVIFFIIFSRIDFEIISLFSRYAYIGSIIFLALPLLIGQVTRGAIRWVAIGALTIQPAEIVRPFLLVFFANYLAAKEVTLSLLIKSFILLGIPFLLIVIQPSLGVAILLAIGYLGILLASAIKKRYLVLGILMVTFLLPLFWGTLASYQRQRVFTFLNPSIDPYGVGYNSLQSMISVGSGKVLGQGLGKGIQTQLGFLPERHTDFMFASIAEELGLVGAVFLLAGTFIILGKLISIVENASSPSSRAYVSGLFLTLFIQIFIHVGMNLGLLPITGVPYPLVSAGGSSLLGTMIGLGIAIGAQKKVANRESLLR